jgi:hypothetical protein
MLRCVIAFLPSDSLFASEVCGLGGRRDQCTQFDQRRHIDLRRSHGHAGAHNRINHPPGNRHDDACWTQNLEKLACRPLLNAPNANLLAKIGMPAVMNL